MNLADKMAKFSPPERFSFENPSEWPEWKQRFCRFRTATKLNKDDGSVQVSSLVYAMGSEAEKILASFSFENEEDKEKFDVVLAKFDEYFIPKRNIIHERACFYQRNQLPGEKAETYIRSLYELAANCEFSDKRDEHIRDRLVVGIRDKRLSQKLQLMPTLTLSEAIQHVRQSEDIAVQVSLQTREISSELVQQVIHRTPTRGRGRYTQRPRGAAAAQSSTAGYGNARNCSRCGKRPHAKDEICLATKSTCNKCNKKGHWQRMCKTKTVREITEEMENALFLGAVNEETNEEHWTVQVKIGQTPLNFKIDTGADACVISEETFEQLEPKTEMSPAVISLSTPGGKLKCLGQFHAKMTYKGKCYSYPVYVVPGREANNLLSRVAATEMGLVKRVNEIKDVFQQGGKLKTDPVKIVLKEGAEPYAVNVSRRVPLPLLPKVKAELSRMEKEGIIEKVTEPTEWCTAMVPVLKPNGDVRICVDLREAK